MPARSAGVPRPQHAALPLWHRAPALDALALDDPDRIALLQADGADGGTVRVLAGIAPTLWRAASGATRDELLEAALAEHGEPDGTDAGAAVDAALAELAATGIVTETPEEPVWRIRDDVAWTGSDGRYIVLALDGDTQPIALEGSAALIWKVLAGAPLSTAEIVERAGPADGAARPEVKLGVASFLDALENAGIALSGTDDRN